MKFFKLVFYILIVFFSQTIFADIPLCISLGGACGSALTLREMGLRTEAYPFDWTITPIGSLYEILSDDFKYTLTALEIRTDGRGIIDYYGVNYFHDWPTIKQLMPDASVDFIGGDQLIDDWETYTPDVKKKYDRRIARFRKACLGDKKIYFFRTEYVTKEEAIILRDQIRFKYPSLDFTLVVIRNDITFKKPWKIEGIRNFSATYYDVSTWLKELKKIDPDFDVTQGD